MSELPTQEIVAAYEHGESLREIAAKYECSPTTIRNELRRAGTQLRPRGSQEQRGKLPLPEEEIVERYANGETLRSLATAYGISTGPIRRILAAHETEMRDARPPTIEELGVSMKEVYRRHREGESGNALAAEHGISPRTVRRYLAEMNGDVQDSPE
ncbi:helix-turn-helix domain-containing protein [Streptomyces sp. NPDC005969]|uniref:helix-turn-helix domain-containing protein n=1 Tax=Streptomyces sp. NPDC005969 TaxID=3156722 RepID=UPI0033C56B5B